MRSTTLISVVIPNWNGEATLRECLDSLRGQSYRDLEVLVVDNASADRSVEIIRSEYPGVRLFRLEENTGFTGACNLGISEAGGEFIALFNNDMIAAGDWLENLFLAADTSPRHSMFASRIFWKEESGRLFSAGDFVLRGGKSLGRGHNEMSAPEYEREEEVFGPCAGAALYRRSFFEDVGTFDEDFFAYLEDTDLSFRGQLKGHRCLYVPTAVTYHYGMHSLRDRSEVRVGYCFRNYFFFMIKDFPFELWLENLPEVAKTVWSETAYAFTHFRCKGGFLFALRKVIDLCLSVFKKMPSMVQKRRKVQKSRRVGLEYLRALLR
jgi:GT2 family glycosyltransferase